MARFQVSVHRLYDSSPPTAAEEGFQDAVTAVLDASQKAAAAAPAQAAAATPEAAAAAPAQAAATPEAMRLANIVKEKLKKVKDQVEKNPEVATKAALKMKVRDQGKFKLAKDQTFDAKENDLTVLKTFIMEKDVEINEHLKDAIEPKTVHRMCDSGRKFKITHFIGDEDLKNIISDYTSELWNKFYEDKNLKISSFYEEGLKEKWENPVDNHVPWIGEFLTENCRIVSVQQGYIEDVLYKKLSAICNTLASGRKRSKKGKKHTNRRTKAFKVNVKANVKASVKVKKGAKATKVKAKKAKSTKGKAKAITNYKKTRRR